MKKRTWTQKEKGIVALVFVAVALFFGLTTGARYPALVTSDATFYPRDYDEGGDYTENTRCWGIPVIYWSCRTTLEENSAVS